MIDDWFENKRLLHTPHTHLTTFAHILCHVKSTIEYPPPRAIIDTAGIYQPFTGALRAPRRESAGETNLAKTGCVSKEIRIGLTSSRSIGNVASEFFPW